MTELFKFENGRDIKVHYDKEQSNHMYRYNNITFRVSEGFVGEILFSYGIDIFSHIRRPIDRMISMAKKDGLSLDFSVSMKFEWDFSQDSASTTVTVRKIDRLPEDADWVFI